MNKWLLGVLAIVIIVIIAGFGLSNTSLSSIAGVGGFDQFGYNNTARTFNGTGSSWCLAKNQPALCMGQYSADKLVMKWTADWDRGNAENWLRTPYSSAWTDNEWNGKVDGGSGAVWHYKKIGREH